MLLRPTITVNCHPICPIISGIGCERKQSFRVFKINSFSSELALWFSIFLFVVVMTTRPPVLQVARNRVVNFDRAQTHGQFVSVWMRKEETAKMFDANVTSLKLNFGQRVLADSLICGRFTSTQSQSIAAISHTLDKVSQHQTNPSCTGKINRCFIITRLTINQSELVGRYSRHRCCSQT